MVCMSGFVLRHTYSSDALAQGILKSFFFCLHKFLHAVTEVRACGTESPTIVGKARHAFAQLANHIAISIDCMYACTCVCVSMYVCMYICMYVCSGFFNTG